MVLLVSHISKSAKERHSHPATVSKGVTSHRADVAMATDVGMSECVEGRVVVDG